MKTNNYLLTVILLIILSFIFILNGCKKDNDGNNNIVDERLSPVYSYQLLSTSSDFLSQANAEGANGYIWKFSYMFSGTINNIFTKDKTETDIFTYKLLDATNNSSDFLIQANSEGANGYIWKGNYIFSGTTKSIYIKNAAESNTFTYKLLDATSSSSDFLAQVNSEGANGYIWKGNYIFSGTTKSIYIKNAAESNTFTYKLLDAASSSTDFLAQANSEGDQEYLYKNTYYFNKSFNLYCKSILKLNLITEHCFVSL